MRGTSWLWSHGSWIYNYLCNQFPSPLMLWVRISIRARCTTLCDKVWQWLATCQWFFPGPPVSSTNKTDCHDITEILLKRVVNTIKQINNNQNETTYLFTIFSTGTFKSRFSWQTRCSILSWSSHVTSLATRSLKVNTRKLLWDSSVSPRDPLK